MNRHNADDDALTPTLVLRAYAIGIFPMASCRHGRTIHWVAPAMRGVLPLEHFHVPRSLRKAIRRAPFEVRFDSDFVGVVGGCAEPRPGHPETWINRDIARVFRELFDLGYAHTVEVWRGDCLVGGLYGLALGSAFFGESMFSRATDASKIALVHLVARLRHGGFTLLDTQFVTDHLRQFGAVEVPNARYLHYLDQALRRRATFYSGLTAEESEAALSAVLTQSSTHTS
jgi:leucyl/phenylalanyl-tRNA--protein transferase